MDAGLEIIDRLATLLHTHIQLVSNIENLILAAKAGSGIEELRLESEKLKTLRARLIEDLSTLLNSRLTGEELLDAKALAGYYLEAGSKREHSALINARQFIDVDEDLRQIEYARRLATRLVSMNEA